MIRGLMFVPLDLRTLSKALRQAYALLDQEAMGVMFIQIPSKFITPERINEISAYEANEVNSLQDVNFYPSVLKQWADFIKNDYGTTLEVQLGGEVNSDNAVLRILRKPGAPKELPLLDLTELK